MAEEKQNPAVKKKKLSSFELSAFCLQISMMLESGIEIDDGIDILRNDTEDKTERALFTTLVQEMDEGQPLFRALQKTGVFPKYMIDMVEIGEKTGSLDEVMRSLAVYYDREYSVQSSIKSAITYPAMMILVMVVIVALLIWKVLPIFEGVFDQLGATLSPVTEALMNVGSGILIYGAIVVGVLLVAALVTFFCYKKGYDRFPLVQAAQAILRRSKLSRLIATGRFASSMSLMFSSGLGMEESLDMSEKMVGNPVVSKKIHKCQDLMLEGKSLVEAMGESDIFPNFYLRMMKVGARSGKSDRIMDEIAGRYTEQVNTKIESVVGRIEPTLVIVLSVVVGLILLSVMLPLMGIMSSIG